MKKVILQLSSFINNCQTNYNLYLFPYESIMLSIDIDTQLGYKLRNEKEVNRKIHEYITESDAIAICSDGSKTRNTFV